MAKEIAKKETQLSGLTPVVKGDIEGLTGGGNYLPQIRIMAFTSSAVQDDKIKAGHFALVTGDIIDLGTSFDCIPLDYRTKATRNTDDDGFMVTWDKGTPLWNDIKRLALEGTQDEKMSNSYGIEFLMWLPEHGYVTYFANSKTARTSSTALLTLTEARRVTHFETKLLEKGKYKWFGPIHTPASVPMVTLPITKEAQEKLDWYQAQTNTEVAEESSRD